MQNSREDIKKLKASKLKVGIAVVNNNRMKSLNRRFCKKTFTTDVLSFEVNSRLPRGFYFLGDVVINIDQAKKQAKEFKCSLEEEIARLVSHGVLHLLGFKDDSKSRHRKMRESEESIIKTLKC